MSLERDERPAPVGYADRVSIATPEGVELELTLAGIGSRFMAAFVDAVIQITVLVAAFFLTRPAGDLGAAIFALVGFLVIFLYDVLFEVLAGGRTPGKRWVGLRVVRTGGRPVTLVRSALRNVMRFVDVLPVLYGVGAVAVFATRRNQRLGDLVAGTYVIRDRTPGDAAAVDGGDGLPDPGEAAGWDLSAVTAEDVATVRAFLARRDAIDRPARARLADDLAARLRPRVAGAPAELSSEAFLERLAAAKAARG